MKKFLTSMMLMGAMTAAGDNNLIYVDMGTRGTDVPSSMYGVFFEEINHAGDGGLYAEMLQNRGFEEQVLPSGMTLGTDGKAHAAHLLNYYGMDYANFWVYWDVESKKYQGWSFNNSGCDISKDVSIPAGHPRCHRICHWRPRHQ